MAEYFAKNPSSFCESSEKNLTQSRFVVEMKGEGRVFPQNLLSPRRDTQSPSITLTKSFRQSLSADAMFILKDINWWSYLYQNVARDFFKLGKRQLNQVPAYKLYKVQRGELLCFLINTCSMHTWQKFCDSPSIAILTFQSWAW